MSKILTSFALILLLSGCVTQKTVDPGSDPVIVNAERTITYAKETMNAFVQYEYANRAIIKDDQVRKHADYIRANGIKWLEDANRLKNVYRREKSDKNRTSLEKALTFLIEGLTLSQRYMLNTSR